MSIYDYLILAVIAAMVAAVFIHRAVQKKKGIPCAGCGSCSSCTAQCGKR